MPGDGSPYADTHDMLTVHVMFRREYALLPGLVRGVAAGDVARAKVVSEHVGLVNTVLHHHHTAEDAVLWPLLLARAPREVDPVVHLLEGQHEGLDALVDEADGRAKGWAGSAQATDREAAAVALQRLTTALYEHMGLEEKLALPLVERHVFATEWEAMVTAGAAGVPPEIGPVLAGMLMYEGGAEVVPAEMREALAEAAPRAYAAYCERVHAVPAPPRSTQVGLGTPYVGVIDADTPATGRR